MIARAVIGANFGDEGKGLVTDYLCSQGAGIVVRYNGGAQAGHTVVTPEGERHVFHHMGSGTLCGIPTFLSEFFVGNPILFEAERMKLIELGFHPVVYAHPNCLITTFADMMINQAKELTRGNKRHGSCGVGFHETQVRSRVPELKITMADLWNGAIGLEAQLAEITSKYVPYRLGGKRIQGDVDAMMGHFKQGCLEFAQHVHPLGIAQCRDIVFEGSQGLLLDQDNKEFFPHVTHSHTGMRNIEILCQSAGVTKVDIYYVSRSYLTRHGAGPLPGEDPDLDFDDETNHENPFQGKLRFARLDCDGLIRRCREDARGHSCRLVITHRDQCDCPEFADLYSYGRTRKDLQA